MEYIDEEDVWRCPECGRVIKFEGRKKIILTVGNQYAVHTGGRGGVVIKAPEITQ